jgi:serine protease Do
MSARKTTLFYMVLVAIASIAVGMVIASRLDLSPDSTAQVMLRPAVNNAPLGGPIDALTFRKIAQEEIPAVVNIRTESKVRSQDLTESFGDDLLRRFFGPGGRPQQPQQEEPRQEGTGTGFVIDAKEGLVLTNNHVVEGATSIVVAPYGAERLETYDAELVGRDLLTDSALVRLKKLPSHPLAQVRFGSSDEMQPGDWVMAIGNPFGLSHTVTVGVISAKGRPYGGVQGREQDMLQTDAAINPGNSGGPLLNIRGEVVGINTSIISDERQGNLGIGFAMPINTILDILPQLKAGKVTRGVIGIEVSKDAITAKAAKQLGLSSRSGAIVTSVGEGGPAARGGMKPGDVIVEFNGTPIKDSNELVYMVVRTKPGTSVPVVVMRDTKRTTLSVTIDELDLDAEAGGQRRGGGGEREEPTTTGLGMELAPLTPEIARRLEVPGNRGGAVVTNVERRSAAFNGNVVRGDVILEVNRQPVSSISQITSQIQRVPSGEVVFLLVWRNGQEVFLTITKP